MIDIEQYKKQRLKPQIDYYDKKSRLNIRGAYYYAF